MTERERGCKWEVQRTLFHHLAPVLFHRFSPIITPPPTRSSKHTSSSSSSPSPFVCFFSLSPLEHHFLYLKAKISIHLSFHLFCNSITEAVGTEVSDDVSEGAQPAPRNITSNCILKIKPRINKTALVFLFARQDLNISDASCFRCTCFETHSFRNESFHQLSLTPSIQTDPRCKFSEEMNRICINEFSHSFSVILHRR